MWSLICIKYRNCYRMPCSVEVFSIETHCNISNTRTTICPTRFWCTHHCWSIHAPPHWCVFRSLKDDDDDMYDVSDNIDRNLQVSCMATNVVGCFNEKCNLYAHFTAVQSTISFLHCLTSVVCPVLRYPTILALQICGHQILNSNTISMI